MTLRNVLLLALIGLSSFSFGQISSLGSPWAWRCKGPTEEESECIREKIPATTDPALMTLNTCKLTCGKYATLMPKPKQAVLGKSTDKFLPSGISHENVRCEPDICPLLTQAVAIMTNTLNKYHPDFSETASYWTGPWEQEVENHTVTIKLSVNSTEEYLNLSTDESYKLNITTSDNGTLVQITAETFFGARHALETLSQLIDYDEEDKSLQIVSSALIEDSPFFPYRGFLIDTSRNFISVKQIKKTLDGMSYNKLNSFHWHITDSHSFPLVLNSLPKMALYGAYSPRHVYTPQDVKDIVNYARVRGIRVVPEIDAPAHVGHGWEWGEEAGMGKLVVCLNKQPWGTYCLQPPCGQLNLANPKIYDVFGTLYEEIVELFSPLELFHFGGDEIHLNCWNTSTEMTDWMTTNNIGLEEKDFFGQWNVFQEKARQLLVKANKNKEIPAILCISELTRGENAEKYIDKLKYIIQLRTYSNDPRIPELLKKGYRVIFSNFDALYFDCGAASYVGKGSNWCSPYKGWQDVYDNDIHAIAFNLTGSDLYHDQILGGEAAVWSEQIDDRTHDAKLWPRGSALAERLWTNPSTDY